MLSGEMKSDTFQVSKKYISDKTGKIFLVPVGNPAQEFDDFCEDGTKIEWFDKNQINQLMVQIRNDALDQHPEWLQDVQLTPRSFAYLMHHDLSNLERFLRHPHVKEFLKDKSLVRRRFWADSDFTALDIAIMTRNEHMVRFLVEDVGTHKTGDENAKRMGNALRHAMSYSSNIVRYLLTREETPLTSADGENYFAMAIQTGNRELGEVFLNSNRNLTRSYLEEVLSTVCQTDVTRFTQRLSERDVDLGNGLTMAIKHHKMEQVLTLMRSPKCKITEIEAKQAETSFLNAQDYEYDDYGDRIYSDDKDRARGIRYAMLFYDAAQTAITCLAREALLEDGTINERAPSNRCAIEILIDDIMKIDVPVTCCLEYLSRIIDAIKASQKKDLVIVNAVTFFTGCFVRLDQKDQKAENKEAHWVRGLLENDQQSKVTRNCFNLFFKAGVTVKCKEQKEDMRNELYKGLEEELKPLEMPDQMVLKKKAIERAHTMFVLGTNGNGGEGTRGKKMKEEVRNYEKQHGTLMLPM